MGDAVDFVQDNMYVLVLVLGALGLWLKNTPFIKDWWIPYILGLVGIILASLLLQDVVQGIIQGILVTSVTVYGHNLIKQGIKRSDS